MEEEFNEYKAAVKHALPEFDDPGRMNAVIDELADLNAVVFHSAVILGISQRDLLEMAYDKVKGRQTGPNYKRTPRTNRTKVAAIVPISCMRTSTGTVIVRRSNLNNHAECIVAKIINLKIKE